VARSSYVKRRGDQKGKKAQAVAVTGTLFFPGEEKNTKQNCQQDTEHLVRILAYMKSDVQRADIYARKATGSAWQVMAAEQLRTGRVLLRKIPVIAVINTSEGCTSWFSTVDQKSEPWCLE
jgi:hypothetical protein